MTEKLDEQAQAFAMKITELAQALSGSLVIPFRSDVINAGSGSTGSWKIEVGNEDHIPLFVDGEERFSLEANWSCTSNGDGDWLKVTRSNFHVFLSEESRRPIFRYEFQDSIGRALPKAHIHFHSEHKAMSENEALKFTEQALMPGGSGSRRARKRTKGNLAAMHFPVGGPRFRPALEDVLKMMIEEYGVSPIGMDLAGFKHLLDQNILDWRTTQVRAVVSDMPSIAVECLTQYGYKVSLPPAGPRKDSPEKLMRH